MRATTRLLVGTVCLGLFSGCGGESPGADTEGSLGTLSAAVELGPTTHDVAAVRFDIVAADSSCDTPAIASQTVSLEAEPALGSLEGAEAVSHHFATGLFVLAPGSYRSCATPLVVDLAPSPVCAQGSELATVVAEQANQVVLVSQCQGSPNGGLDVAVTLNDPPQITAVTVTESTYITICESATIAVSANDPNGDALAYAWSVVSGPDAGRLRANDSSAIFSGVVGDYVLSVVVSDTHAAQTSFLVAVHVADATCVVPPDVQAILVAKCSPCHTTGASGGLKLDPADVAYSALVSHAVGAAACSSSVRVVPGDPANSYLIAKLRNTAGICGVQMPRGRPPLPEEEIQTIEAWIQGLPH
jgi:hypothetical protein